MMPVDRRHDERSYSAAPPTLLEGVRDAISGRRSVRAFSSRPVPREVISDLLSVASRAPSGSNMQPWQAYVLTGSTLKDTAHRLCAAFDEGLPEQREYRYYPVEWRSPYTERRRAAGWGLYELVGVQRGDRQAAMRQRRKNYQFFGAPVGIVFTIHRDLEIGSWLDYGMFLHAVMVAARGYGLDTCPQAAIANYPSILRDRLGIPEGEIVICGMALGFIDSEGAVNKLLTERAQVTEFARFFD